MSGTPALVALDWLREEIDLSLSRAQDALYAAVESESDRSRLSDCLDTIHQIQGTFHIAGLEGPARIASEMELVARALKEGSIEEEEKAQVVLMQSILQFPRYLDNIQRLKQEMPVLSRSMSNQLRVVRGEKPLESSGDKQKTEYLLDCFKQPVEALTKTGFEKLNGSSNVPKLRQRYLQALVALFHKRKPRTNLMIMGKIFVMLERLCGESPLGHLWIVMGAMVEGLTSGSIRLDRECGQLLKKTDAQLKRLAESGGAALDQAIEEDFARAVLSKVLSASKPSQKVQHIRDNYTARQDQQVNDFVNVGPDNETLRRVVDILIGELQSIIDKIDLYTRMQPKNKDELVSLLPSLQQISSTLSIIGLGEYQSVINEQLDALKALDSSVEEPVEEQLLSMAQAFLELESRLSDQIMEKDEQDRMNSFGSLGDATSIVIKETRVGLSICTNAIADFVSSEWNRKKIEGLSELLIALRGSLILLEKQKAANVVLACARFVEKLDNELGQEDKVALSGEDLDYFADAIAAIDYYLERHLQHGLEVPDSIIEAGERAVEKLGFEVSWVLQQEAEREPASNPGANERKELPLEDEHNFEAIDDEMDVVVESREEDDSNAIQSQIREATERIRMLSAHAARPGDVVLLINELVSVISDVADKTDLLSTEMNSTSLDSGKAGTDFSEAAGQIQKLAERSDIAARQLNELKKLAKKKSEDSSLSLTAAEKQ